jgi:class 3 adenylate cyclase/tetratricopeptide (TPR) repeat protein
MVTCPNCQAESSSRFRVCGQCGTQLGVDRPPEEIRRIATVVTSDLKGSTALGEKLDPESLREVLTRYFDEMRVVYESHGGTIEKIIGDAIVAVFGLPTQRDDDALRAVQAAAESLRVLGVLNEQLEEKWGVRLIARTGVASGEVIVGELTAGSHVLTGETIRLATVMEQNAPALEVLLADSTYQLVASQVEAESFGPVFAKGSEQPLLAHRLLTVAATVDDGESQEASATSGRVCSVCGELNPTEHRFCGTCGSELTERVTFQESRKTVTIVFADPKPTTATGQPPSAEALRDVMTGYFDVMKGALEKHGGTVEKFIGDAVMAVFGLPVRHEDDAVRAIRAAAEMQAALPALNEHFRAQWDLELQNHIGVNTGPVIAGDGGLGQRLVTGDAVNTAARLEQAAGAAEIILGELTYRLARNQVEVQEIEPLLLKGKAEPVPAYRLVRVAERTVERVDGDTPFVGRAIELQQLVKDLDQAVATSTCRLISIIGDAGVGKTRLLREFTQGAAGRAQVFRGRCLAYGDGVTYWPILEIVRSAARIAEEDPPEVALAKIAQLAADPENEGEDAPEIAERVASAIGISASPFRGPELFWGIRRLVEAMARRSPLVLVVDDAHFAAPTFLELVDHLLEASQRAPILLVAVGRHELLETHRDWANAHLEGRLTLEPLTGDDSNDLLDRLLGGLDEGVRTRIVNAAEGNPLYVEQITSMLVERGALRKEDGRWLATDAAHEISVPPTVEALVAARLDILRPHERQVIEPASVIGLGFPLDALIQLVDGDARPTIPDCLGTLMAKQLVRPVTAGEFYRFGHAVIKDTTYGSLLKRTRAALHEAFVAWAEPVNRERGRETEFEEILGYHLEQAYRYRVELGAIDGHAREIGAHAAEKLANSGRRAMARGDRPAAASLFRRAVALLPDETTNRVELLPELANALIDLGAFEEATQAIAEALVSSERIGAVGLKARAVIAKIFLEVYSGESSRGAGQAIRDLEAAIHDLEAIGDDLGLGRAWIGISLVAGNAGQFERAARAALEAVPHAQRVGDVRRIGQAASNYAAIALFGPTPVPEVIERCEELYREAAGDRMAESVILGTVAVLYAMRGSFDEARSRYRRSREMLLELGPTVTAMSASTESSRVEMLAGDPAAAEQELRRDFGALEAIGEKYFRSTIASLLAEALYAQDRFAEAAEFALLAEKLADPDDSAVQILWRTTRAKLLARDGSPADAERLIDEAVERARGSESPTLIGGVLADQAEVLFLDDRREAGEASLREALQLFEGKGDLVSAERIRVRLAELAA